MTVTAVTKDPQKLTLTLTAEFDASPERVWQLRASSSAGGVRPPTRPPSRATA